MEEQRISNLIPIEEYHMWKGLEEEVTYTTYIRRQTSYQPKATDGKM